MSVCSTRCMAAFRLSVPDRAWLTSRSVERRRASRAAVDESGPERAAGMVQASYFLNFRLRVLEPAAGGRLPSCSLLTGTAERRSFIRFCSNGDVTPRVCGFGVASGPAIVPDHALSKGDRGGAPLRGDAARCAPWGTPLRGADQGRRSFGQF